MRGSSGARREAPHPPPAHARGSETAMPLAQAIPRRDRQRAPGKRRVLFLCVGNACRSQMAEAFARAYGADVIAPASAGLHPAVAIPPLTRLVLEERNIRIDGQFPKGLEQIAEPFDLLVNLSGERVRMPGIEILEWPVPDPIGQKPEVYRSTAADIEARVMRLILDLRPA
jgi:arsenate reductase